MARKVDRVSGSTIADKLDSTTATLCEETAFLLESVQTMSPRQADRPQLADLPK